MEHHNYLRLETLLVDLDRKVNNLQSEISSLRSEVSLLREESATKGFSSANLKAEFEDFKSQWQSEAPDMQNLKDNLLKLRASLGGLTQVLSQQTNDEPPADQSR